MVGVGGGESWAMWCGGDASTSGGARGDREGPVPGYRGHVVMWSCDLVFLC